MLLRNLAIILLVLTTEFIQAQDNLFSPPLLPQSPEAAAFAKNINIPISYSSGTPQISIPFATVKSGSMEIPVSISYNASGIRVEEVPTWVGLGWSLSAGGQITRTVRGLNDESSPLGYMNAPYYRKVKYIYDHSCHCDEGNPFDWEVIYDLNVSHTLDLEPDQFSFSVLGYSGDFYWNQDSGKYILFPYQNILIEGTPGAFTLTLPNGVRCSFGGGYNYEESALSGSTIDVIDNEEQDAVSSGIGYGTTWMLQQVEDPVGRTIEFTYGTETIITFGVGGEKYGMTITDLSYNKNKKTFFKQIIKKPVLEKISGENINIYFKKSSAHRLDMPDYSYGSRSLDTIVITTPNNNEIKSYYFSYGYFTSPETSYSGNGMVDTYVAEARKRLYLKSITEKTGTDSLPPYEFTYNDSELPSRLSFSQDYWGYYNGKTNSRMLPRILRTDFIPNQPAYDEENNIRADYIYLSISGADKRIDSTLTASRILTKIKYPTGGTTEYFYEQNKASLDYLSLYGGIEPPDMVERSYSLNLLSTPLPIDPPDGYPTSFTGTFHINLPVTKVKITPQLPSPCGIYQDVSCKFLVKLKKMPEGTLITSFSTTSTIQIQLETGDYQVEVLNNGSNTEYPPMFDVTCQWGERTDSINFLVGGVRVRKVVSSDSVNNSITRSFRYTYDSSTKSSGILDGCPTYRIFDRGHDGGPENTNLRRYYMSNSILPLTQDGKTIRYSFVSEFLDTAMSSLRTDYTFTSGIFSTLKFMTAVTGAPICKWNWENNLLKRKQVFEKLSMGYRPILDEQHYYQVYELMMDMFGLYGGQMISYPMATEWYLPDSVSTTTYAYEGSLQRSIVTGEKTVYNNNYLPFNTITKNSKGQILHNKTWYATDYNNVSGYNISSLYGKHIWTTPIKQESSVDGKVRSGTIVKYDANGLPIEGYNYENATFSDTVTHDRNIVLESNYVSRAKLYYDVNSNLHQYNSYKSGPVTYIWDYQINGFTGDPFNKHIIAAVQNADSNSVAYTSFENVSQGHWTYLGTVISSSTTPSGEKAYSLDGGATVTKSGLNNAATYFVSYWAASQQTVSNTTSVITGKTINGWTYYEHKIVNPTSGTITISGLGAIDELRLYPEKALMTTYVYNNMWDLGATCDQKGIFSYFEYDAHSRLKLIRDQDGNILKKYEYKYASQNN